MSYSCTITEAGIAAPDFATILAQLQAAYRAIYGDDAYLEPDGQDGEWIALIAAAINDCNAATIAAYNAFSPATAQGAGLSSVVAVNGIRRAAPSRGTVDLRVSGTVGTVIANGIAADDAGNRWLLPASVTIPLAGEVIVTATAEAAGALRAQPGGITRIATPTLGWQAVTNPAAATPGAPVETDAALRLRQQASVARPSRSVLEGLVGDVRSLPGVSRLAAMENDTPAADANGIPANSIALVVEGGDAAAIAGAIARRKTPGTGTHGTTSVLVTTAFGVVQAVRFFRPAVRRIGIAVDVQAMPGYTSAIGARIAAALSAYVTALPIGDDVLIGRLYVPAGLYGTADAQTFNVTAIRAGFAPATPGTANLALAFNEAAFADAADITLNVTA